MARSNRSEKPTRAVSDDPVADALAPEVEPDTEPIDEPRTPQDVLDWNRYYDRYVAAGVLLLVFLVSAHKITSIASPIWPMLRFGELIVREGGFITTDRFSFTEAGKPWVNIPWIYEVGSHLVFSSLKTNFPGEPGSNTGNQVGAAALVALNALARVLTIMVLFRMRRAGPGLWWFAIAATLALGYMVAPRGEAFELSSGGIARMAVLSPETWGNLFLAIAILLLDRALILGRKGALYALPPLFLLWANFDDSFAFGLLVLVVGTVASLVLGRRDPKGDGVSPALALGIAFASIAICVINPSTWRIYPVAFEPYLSIPKMVFSSGTLLPLPDQLSFFGADSWRAIQQSGGDLAPRLRLAYYLIIVLAGLATFALDFRRLSVFRLALYVLSALAWGGLNRISAEFSIVFVYVVGLNGQEWYQRRYGVQGHLGSGWTTWSIGGRALTIVVLFLMMAKTLTGYNYALDRPTFGFGYDDSSFDFEAAEFVKASKIEGQIININEALGDAIIARAYPTRRSFIDRRRGLFSTEVRRDLAAFRSSFTKEFATAEEADEPSPSDSAGDAVDARENVVVTLKEDPAKWRPVLDKYKASAVILTQRSDFNIYGTMLGSKNWILIYDNGRSAMFGRADASAADLALFESQKLDANEIVYHRKDRIPFPDRSPAPITFIDSIIRNRTLGYPQPHFVAGQHWLAAGATEENGGRPDEAHSIMAIREARKAIHYNPDESDAYRLLDFAYDKLSLNEYSVFAAQKQGVPMGFFSYRARQRITALNYAIQTTPKPRDATSRAALSESHMKLADLFRQTGDLDMERDNLAAARELYPPGTFPLDQSKRLDQLDDAIRNFNDRLEKASTQPGMEGNQLARADFARQSGFTGIAIRELEEAENLGVPLDRYLNTLVSLYCRTGQPEKANEKLGNRVADDAALYQGAGTPSYTHGLVNLLLGFYDNAIGYWRDGALGQAIQSEKQQGLALAREILSGFPDRAVDTAMNLTGLPGKPGLVEIEASWEFELALALLESGDPFEAGKHFLKALEFNPQIPVRPLIEHYLKKLGVAIPPDPSVTSEANPAEPEKAPAVPESNPAETEKAPAAPEIKPENEPAKLDAPK